MGHDLGPALEHALHDGCAGRLGHIEWFHAAWQRGGAATGFAVFREQAGGASVPVMVKAPVGPAEYRWTVSLSELAQTDPDIQRLGAPTPRVLAHGMELGGYDMAWLVVERLLGGHPSRHLGVQGVEAMMRAVLAFHMACRLSKPMDTNAKPPPTPAWAQLLERGRAICHDQAIADHHPWNDALKRVQRALPLLERRWAQRPITTWCHGDVHPGNVLLRKGTGGSGGSGGSGGHVLIDMALVHPGFWIEDALYLERQYWGHESWLEGAKPLTVLGRLRREAGLVCESESTSLANVRRVLMAACAPAVIEREGASPAYLRAALGVIHRLLPMVDH